MNTLNNRKVEGVAHFTDNLSGRPRTRDISGFVTLCIKVGLLLYDLMAEVTVFIINNYVVDRVY